MIHSILALDFDESKPEAAFCLLIIELPLRSVA